MNASLGLAIVTGRAVVAPHLDVLMFSSFMFAVLTLALYREYFRSKGYGLALSISTAVTAVLGCMEGAWPMGIVMCIWSATVFWSWWNRNNVTLSRDSKPSWTRWPLDSRMTRLFGSAESSRKAWDGSQN